MYKVNVKIKASDPNNPISRYKPVTWRGIYLPKNQPGKMAHEKIKADVESRLRPGLEEQHPGLTIELNISIEKLPTDFCFQQQ